MPSLGETWKGDSPAGYRPAAINGLPGPDNVMDEAEAAYAGICTKRGVGSAAEDTMPPGGLDDKQE